jgi:hypothetical protein
MKKIVASSATCSEIWIHYSGHGLRLQVKTGAKITLDDEIVPMDYQANGFIIDNDLFSIFKNIKCRAFLVFDSCHSASVSEMPWLFEYVSGNTFSRARINNNIVSNPNIFVFSGCKDTQTSADVYDTETRQYVGAMTISLLRSLKTNNYKGGVLKIYMDCYINLVKNGFTQRPCLSSSTDTPGYIIVAPPPPPAAVILSNMPSIKTSTTKKSLFYINTRKNPMPMIYA